jgi:predicted phosphodiesterase
LKNNSQKIAIISDIHSNSTALSCVLKNIKEKKINKYIFLGDLLTYGIRPNKVIKTLINFKKNNNCVFIKGNHDQFYFDLQNGKNTFDYKMPTFIKESIIWTKKRLKFNLLKTFNWVDFHIVNSIYISHSNPYSYGNWTYLNNEKEYIKAFNELERKKIDIGIFGHTHRASKVKYNKETKEISQNEELNNCKMNNKYKFILNSGSIGQPRGKGLSYLIIDNNLENFEYFFLNHSCIKKSIFNQTKESDLNEDTKQELYSFWSNLND